jgi:hypothetical protein
MSDPRTRTSNAVDPVVAAHERAVEQNREQLADTVDALQDKLDVKSQAQGQLRNAKMRLARLVVDPRRVVVGAVAGAAVLTAVLVFRRRR